MHIDESSILQYLQLVTRGLTSLLSHLPFIFFQTPSPSCCPWIALLCVVIAFHIVPIPPQWKLSISEPSPPLTAGIETCLPKQHWVWTFGPLFVINVSDCHSLCPSMCAKVREGVKWHLNLMFCFPLEQKLIDGDSTFEQCVHSDVSTVVCIHRWYIKEVHVSDGHFSIVDSSSPTLLHSNVGGRVSFALYLKRFCFLLYVIGIFKCTHTGSVLLQLHIRSHHRNSPTLVERKKTNQKQKTCYTKTTAW